MVFLKCICAGLAALIGGIILLFCSAHVVHLILFRVRAHAGAGGWTRLGLIHVPHAGVVLLGIAMAFFLLGLGLEYWSIKAK